MSAAKGSGFPAPWPAAPPPRAPPDGATPTRITGLQLPRQLRQALLQALALVRQPLVRGTQLRGVRLARPRQLLGIVLARGGKLDLLRQLLPLGSHAGQLAADQLQPQGQGFGRDGDAEFESPDILLSQLLTQVRHCCRPWFLHRGPACDMAPGPWPSRVARGRRAAARRAGSQWLCTRSHLILLHQRRQVIGHRPVLLPKRSVLGLHACQMLRHAVQLRVLRRCRRFCLLEARRCGGQPRLRGRQGSAGGT